MGLQTYAMPGCILAEGSGLIQPKPAKGLMVLPVSALPCKAGITAVLPLTESPVQFLPSGETSGKS